MLTQFVDLLGIKEEEPGYSASSVKKCEMCASGISFLH